MTVRTLFKGIIFLLILLLATVASKAQTLEHSFWTLATDVGIYFPGGTGAPIDTTHEMKVYESTATVSDASGNLLFYTNGIDVYNSGDTLMPGGDGTMMSGDGGGTSGSGAQGVLVTRSPSDCNTYYIIMVDDPVATMGAGGMWWATVDMTANGGAGQVSAPTRLQDETASDFATTEYLTVTRHGNGTDLWIMAHEHATNKFLAYQLTGAGINPAPVVSSVGFTPPGWAADMSRGTIRFSNSGDKLAKIIHHNAWPSEETVELFDFNNNTGVLTLSTAVGVGAPYNNGYSLEWSPDDSKLYCSFISSGVIAQYDLSSWGNEAAIEASVTPVDTSIASGQLKLGGDGRIYNTNFGSRALSAIGGDLNGPVSGLIFVDSAVVLDSPTEYSLPNMEVYNCGVVCPSLNLGNPPNICSVDTLILTDYNGTAALGTWSILTPPAGSNPATINAGVFDPRGKDIGIYILEYNLNTITPGCDSNETRTITVHPQPAPNLGNDTSICADSSLILDAQIGVSWLWNTTETTQQISINTAGDFDVSVTDGNGCMGYDTINLSINALPIVDLGNDTSICADSTLLLDAQIAASWLWNTTETTQQITINSSGDFDVAVTDANGCVGYDTINLSITPLPIVNLGNDTAICADSSLVLDAQTGASWMWNTTEITQQITINSSGDYDVIVTDANGCVGYDTLNLSINSLPIIDLGNDTAICADSSLILDAQIGVSWLWNTTETTQQITINSSGDFDVSVTDGNGCVGYDTINLSINTLPIIDLGNDTAICADSSLILDAQTGISWLWNTTETTQQITVNTAGDHDVMVTDANGCVGYDTINLSINALPIIDLGNDTAICTVSTLSLDAQVGVIWLWNTTETTQQITVNTAGDYDVMVTDANGCVGYDTINLSINALPVVDLGNDTSICIDSTLILKAQLGTSWLWNTTETTQQITVNNSGNYDVIVTDINGCVGYDTITINTNNLPVINLGNDTAICDLSALTIDAQTGVSWLWNTSETTQQITINSTGEYSVAVTDMNGCVGYDTITLNIDTLPLVQLGEDTSFCIQDSMVLFHGLSPVATIWSNGSIADSLIIYSGGEFSVVVQDNNGCIGRDTINISVNTLPVISLGGSSSICEGDSMELDAKISKATYLWSPNGETSSSIWVKSAGIYSVIVTDSNNCVDSSAYNLGIHPTPIVNLGVDTAICKEWDYTLSIGTTYNSYLWSNNSTNPSIQTEGQGEYWIIVTDAFGCNGSDTIQVDTLPSPVLSLNLNDSSMCLGDSVQLMANGWVTYSWNGNPGDSSIMAYTAGDYILEITDTNGCSGTDTATIWVNNLPEVELGNSQSVCPLKQIELSVDPNLAQIQWSTGTTLPTESVNAAGTYYVDVVDTNGCANTDTVIITPGTEINLALGNDIEICEGEETVLQTSLTLTSLLWNTGATTSSITVDSSGIYTLYATNDKGCVGFDTIEITVNNNPTVEITSNKDSVCSIPESGENVWLYSSNNTDQLTWNTGEMDDSINITEGAEYWVIATNVHNCSTADSITIIEYCRPIDVTMPVIFTPNGDGTNDNFIPIQLSWDDPDYMLANIEVINFQVYAGQLVGGCHQQ